MGGEPSAAGTLRLGVRVRCMLRHRLSLLALLIGAAYLFRAGAALALPAVVDEHKIPNVETFGCRNCHIYDNNGSPIYPAFTQIMTDWKATVPTKTWTNVFASTDSDGDGWTNEEELQGIGWTRLMPDKTPGDPSKVSNPGDKASNPPQPTVVDISGVQNDQVLSGEAQIGAQIAATYPSDVFLVQFVLQKGGQTLLDAEDESAPYCITQGCQPWDLSGYQDGQYTLKVAVYDKRTQAAGGRRSHTRSESFVINNSGDSLGVRYVSSTGSDSGDCTNKAAPCKSINYAIGKASSGEEIRVAEGVYTSIASVPVAGFQNKSLKLLGGYSLGFEGAPDPAANETILDGEHERRVINAGFGPGAVTVRGFTIRNGVGDLSGGGLFLARDGSEVRENRFEGNEGYNGGAIYMQANGVTVSDNVFVDNRATGNEFSGGGAIFITASSGLKIERNRFKENTASGRGGAIFLESNAAATLARARFEENSAQVMGGAIYAAGALNLSNGLLVGNSAGAGAALASAYGSTSIRYSTIHGGQGDEALLVGEQSDAFTLTNVLISGHAKGVRLTSGKLSLRGVLVANDGANNVGQAIDDDGGSQIDGAPIRKAAGYVGGGDFHLIESAPAIDAGVAENVGEDLEGKARPKNKGYDIGAYEFQGTPKPQPDPNPNPNPDPNPNPNPDPNPGNPGQKVQLPLVLG
jgi:predicted outer membrane repeat protein